MKKSKAKEVKVAQEVYHCPHCGTLLEGTEKFCPAFKCGKKVNINRR